MFKKKPIDKSFVSEIDKALAKFNTENPLSAAQQAEHDKYKRLHQLRDHPTPCEKEKSLWEF